MTGDESEDAAAERTKIGGVGATRRAASAGAAIASRMPRLVTPVRPGGGECGRRAEPTPEQADLRTGKVATKSGVVELADHARRVLEFTVVDGRAIYEGDIDLGSAAELVATMSDVSDNAQAQHAAIVQDLAKRWRDGVVPCDFPASDSPIRAMVMAAVEEFHEHTNARFRPREDDDESHVAFEVSAYCSSQVGRMGGRQLVRVCRTASVGNVIHELCHVLGLWHEQSREDRDDYVRILWPNIQAGYEHNFRQRVADGDDVGAYDYASVMHYPADAFSANGKSTILPLEEGVIIGQRSFLSDGDKAAIDHLYPKVDTVSPTKGGGDELLAELAAREIVQVASGGWPGNAVVHWEVVPLDGPTGVNSINWTCGAGLDRHDAVEHWLTVENLTERAVRVRIRSSVLGVPS